MYAKLSREIYVAGSLRPSGYYIDITDIHTSRSQAELDEEDLQAFRAALALTELGGRFELNEGQLRFHVALFCSLPPHELFIALHDVLWSVVGPETLVCNAEGEEFTLLALVPGRSTRPLAGGLMN